MRISISNHESRGLLIDGVKVHHRLVVSVSCVGVAQNAKDNFL